MSGEYIEQDRDTPSGPDGLPTYDDLATQNGPNSRFGRWRGWIEKRAAERYNDLTPEEFTRRRQRGWALDDQPMAASNPQQYDASAIAHSVGGLHIDTDYLSPESEGSSEPQSSVSLPLPSVSQRIAPSRLKVNHFGSRFLPHSTVPIRCLLPLDSGRVLLVGHDEGLSVLDMFPQEWAGDGLLISKGPNEAHSYPIWHGESVYQMSLLESEPGSDGVQQGVALFLVGPESDSCRDDSIRSLRMYNLASLLNLARWAISHKGAHPLDLHRPANWNVQQSPKRRSQGLAWGLRSLIDSQNNNPSEGSSFPTNEASGATSPSSITSARRRPFSIRAPAPVPVPAPAPAPALIPQRKDTIDSWDVVDDVQLRWATDYVPLATNGSRLMNTSVLSYALWNEDAKKGKGGKLLAVVTKQSILLYKTPKGERAFRFVKDFYTPMQVRKISFFHQALQDSGPSFSDPNASNRHRRTSSSSTIRDGIRPASNSHSYGTQLSIFIVFDKKAGWIRLADSAVGEMELYDAGQNGLHHHSRSVDMHSLSAGSILRGRMSLEVVLSALTTKWILPARCVLPSPDYESAREVLIVTRASVTHVLPYPLPVGSSSSTQPLHVVQWKCKPVSISARALLSTQTPPFLQLIAFNENGIEIQEIGLSFLGKGKARARQLQEPIWAEEDLGGESGFLCTGGHWDRSNHTAYLGGDYSPNSSISRESFTSLESDALMERLSSEEGMYGWCRKGPADWRVFWVGGSADVGKNDRNDKF